LPENGILLWGAAGAGKSHLLRAPRRGTTVRPVIECATPPRHAIDRRRAAGGTVVVDALDSAGPVEQGRSSR
jgi:hypothetical protein